MKPYIGTKQIQAEPMTRGEYNSFRGWDLPDNEDGSDKGYLVRYRDGYVTWSPAKQFEESYRETNNGLTFGMALDALKQGFKVTRTGWNGKDMFLFLVPGSTFKVSRPPLLGIYQEGTEITYRPHIDIRNPDGSIATWSPSNSDALAEDWRIIL